VNSQRKEYLDFVQKLLLLLSMTSTSKFFQFRHLGALHAGRRAQAAAMPPVTDVPMAARGSPHHHPHFPCFLGVLVSVLLVLLVNESEYSQSKGAKPCNALTQSFSGRVLILL
jgi:hypothetical protein